MIKNKIAVVLPDLRGGGVEKMRIKLASEWLKKGYDVEFLLFNAKGALLDTVPKEAKVVDLKCKRILSGIPKLKCYLKSSPPDILLVAMWPLTVTAIFSSIILVFRKKSFRLLVSDHNTLSLSNSHKSSLYKKLLGWSVRVLYPMADRSIVVSKGVGKDLASLSGLPESFFDVIYNPAANNVFDKPTYYPDEFVKSTKNIISVGSLKQQKDYDTLIDAMNCLVKKKHNVCLYILGEGGLLSSLQEKITSLDLSDNIQLVGFKKNVSDYFQNADLFVLSSRWEGFGNVIVEALNHGCPVVSTDCESGPREILEDGKYGKLVPVGDADALAEAMYQSLNADHDLEALKRRAKDFSVEKIAKQYLDVMFPEG